MAHIMDLSRESAERKFDMLKGQVDRKDGLVFTTFTSTIDNVPPGIEGPLTDVITRIWIDGRMMYHGSQFLVVEGLLSPLGTSVFMKAEDTDLIGKMGGWDSIQFWLENSDEMVMFLADSYGDILRGCKQVQQIIGRGSYVDFFKKYDDQFMTAMRGC